MKDATAETQTRSIVKNAAVASLLFHLSSLQVVSNFTDLYFHIRHFSERKFRWNGIFILH